MAELYKTSAAENRATPKSLKRYALNLIILFLNRALDPHDKRMMPLRTEDDNMFQIQQFEESIRVPPKYIGLDVKESVRKSLAERYENRVIKDIGVILAINEVGDIGEGKIMIEDAGVYYKTSFEALVYKPKLYEIITGQVVDITNFGVFVRFGPIDGLCHVSQVINDYVSFEEKTRTLAARDSKRVLKIGDAVRARIIAVSLNKKEVNKINITMRQPDLGSLEWIREEYDAKKKAENSKAKK